MSTPSIWLLPNAATRTVRLQSKRQVADRTTAFHFDKPVGFAFKPGQAVDIVLATHGDAGHSSDIKHTFSIVSAPFQTELVVTTRMRDSAFKRALGALPPGGAVALEGPFGSLTLHKKKHRAAVFIAGGIGITPFMSILRQAAHDRLAQELLLLYSNRRPEDAAFLYELQQMERRRRQFHMIATMTKLQRPGAGWIGRTQRIDRDLVQSAAEGLPDPIFYLAGPPGLVQGMQQTLAEAGVEDDDIRSEEFYGY